jgi:acyl-homoserine-lactone acylase
VHNRVKETTKRLGAAVALSLVAVACNPGEGPESIPLPTSPDTTTTTTTTTVPPPTTTTTTTTLVPPTFEAVIRRTTDGVAHISGRDRSDLAYGQGYVSGEDYGCTLLDQILKVRGERSMFLGPGGNGENVESDFAWHSIDIVGIAASDFAEASEAVVDQFDAFAVGWNRQLADAGPDGLAGWCSDAEWVRPVEAVEVYAYARSIALLASGANFTDFIASAQPPEPPVDEAAPEPVPPAPDFSTLVARDLGSNAWAIGSDRIEGGTGSALMANPHSPWEGELRYAELHLTVPGEIDIYGAQLAGVPGIGIGFTDDVAWSHTVSAGHRFTAYSLDLDPASPTTYLVDGIPTPMTSTDHTVEILRPDGTIDSETRTLYDSEYGPIIDFPGVGWTENTVLTYRDANIDNNEFIEFNADVLDVAGLTDLKETQARHQGVPLFNTVAVGAGGSVWYADTSATPNLSAEAELIFLGQLFTGEGLTALAFDQGVVLLNGSDSRFRWEEVPGARDPGLVPFTEQPQVDRRDYVFNANDSYWVPSNEFTLDGDYSVLHGRQDVPLSMRTRQNALVLADGDPLGLAGDDGNFSAGELRTATFDNTAQTAVLLRESVVTACRANPLVEVPDVLFEDGTVALAAEVIDLSSACAVLDGWDGRFDLDSAGAVLWRETMTRFPAQAFDEAGPLFSEPFDPARPTVTPAGFNDNAALVVQALGRAVQTITKAGFDIDATMGAAQFTDRSGERISLHGGTNADGVTNIVSWSDRSSSSEEAPARGDLITPNGDLRGDGYPVNFGTSFVMVVDYSTGAPEASAMLTYGNTGLRDTEVFSSQTTRFSEKDWRVVAFTDEQITADPALDELTIRES